jgi:hypothetical protein
MKNKTVILVLTATFFGLLSGMVGQIISRAYFLEKDFNMPLFGDISFGDDDNATNLIIRNPKKIVVEQGTKALETAQAVQGGIMGIFLKDSKEDNGVVRYINLQEEEGEAFAITSDGWMISSFVPEEILRIKDKDATSSREKILDISQKYIFISNNSKTYELENILYDPLLNFSFWKIKADDLPVRKLEEFLNNGELVFGLNRAGDILLTTILGKKEDASVLSSDIFIEEILVSDTIDSKLNNSFLFNVYGDLIGFIIDNQKIISIKSLNPLIKNLLKNEKIKRSFLGLNYVNYFNILDLENEKLGAGAKISKNEKEIAILKGSPAEKAGLKEDDIIITINNISLSAEDNLREIINSHLPGDELLLEYLREDELFSIKLKLGSF